MRNVCSAAVVALSILSCSTMYGQSGLSISNYQVVSQQPATLTMWNVTYRATLVNTGGALGSVTATLTSSNPFSVRTVPGQDTLSFPTVSAGGQVASLNTFTVLVNRVASVPFALSMLQWTFQTTAAPPVANAGPNQTVAIGSTVNLDGSGSTNPSGVGTLTYAWQFTSRPAGTSTFLINSTAVKPKFVADVAGSYTITLTVSNGTATSAPSSVTITTGNSAPVANAGPNQSVTVGTQVTLTGSASSDVDGDPLTYSWSFLTVPTGSNAAASMINGNTVSPKFTVDKAGSYTVQLLVNDGHGNTANANVIITTLNTPPVANAGPSQSVNIGALVQLNGSASTDVDGDPLTYQWSFNSVAPGSTPALSNPTAVNPTFTADKPGTYVVQLIVNDGHVNGAAVTVSITTNTILAPVANPGAGQTVVHGTTVQLDGSASSDPQSLPITYSWSLTTRPPNSNATLSSSTAVKPTFVADQPGNYVAQLIVSNGFVSSTPPATVNITTTNTPPVAVAGVNQNVTTGATVNLDGTGSSDADHDPLTYVWTFNTRPAGSSALIQAQTSSTPRFIADVAGTYVIQLIVNDGFTPSTPSTVTITAADKATISLSPSPLNLGTNSTGTLTLLLSAPAGPSGQTINLSSNNSSAASVPFSVLVPANSTGANVTVTTGSQGSATISAFATGYVTGTATVNVTVPTITVSTPSAVGLTKSVTGTVTISSPAPAAGVTVALSAIPGGIVDIQPPTVTIASGNTSGTFTVNGVAQGNTTISGDSGGYISGTSNISVNFLGQITAPGSTTLGPSQTSTFTIGLATAAPVGGVTVNLASDNTSVATISPASVFIAQGTTAPATQPTVTAVNFGTANITASAGGFHSASGQIQVSATLSFQQPSLNIATGSTGTLTLNLSSPAPAGLTINLSSSNTAVATVPATVTFPTNATSVPVTVTGVAQGSGVIIHASNLPNLADVTSTVTVQLFGQINLPSTLSVQVGSPVALGITLSAPAPTGGTTVTLNSSNQSKVTISPATVTISAGQTNPAAQPQVSGLTVGSAVATISASANGFTSPGTTSVSVTAGTAATVVANGGDAQSTVQGTAFAQQLNVIVKDSAGNPVAAGVQVTFAGPASGASIVQKTALTDATGVAKATVTANSTVGSYQVTASVVGGTTSATFSLTNTVGTATTIEATSGGGQSIAISTAFGAQLVATVKDSGGNPVPGQTVTFSAPTGSGVASATLSPSTPQVTDSNGQVKVTATANGTAGSYNVTAGSGSISPAATFALTNTAGAASSITPSPASQSATISTQFATAMTATVKDSGGNLLNNAPVVFTVVPVNNAGGSFTGSLSTVTVNTNSSGVATAPAFTANATAGAYTVTATSGTATATFNLTNNAGAASSITPNPASQSAAINAAFSTMTATVKDSGGNVLNNVPVVFTVVPVNNAGGSFAGSLPTITVNTNSSGVATATTFTANSTAGAYTITATSGSATGTFNLTNIPGPASSITPSPTSQSATVSTQFGTAMSATVKDAGGNALNNAPVVFTVVPNAGASGSFAGSLTTVTINTNASGVATAPAFTANATAGSYTVTATSGSATGTFNLTNTNSSPSSVTPSPASLSTTEGTAFGAMSVTVKDSVGNVLNNIAVTFTVVPVNGAGGAFGANPSATVNTNSFGIATAPTFTANGVAGSYTVTAAAGSASGTFNMTNTVGAVSTITPSPSSQTTVEGTAFGSVLTATVKDSGGNLLSASVVFTVVAGGNGASGTFAGGGTTATVNTVNGVATSPILSANGVAGTFTVKAAVGAVSATFNFTTTVGAVSQIIMTSGNNQTSNVGAQFAGPLKVTVKDSGGNLLAGIPVNFTGPGSGASINPNPASATTDALGVASATVTANSVAGNYNVTATPGSGSGSATFAITNAAIVVSPTSISASQGSGQHAIIGNAFALPLKATVLGAGNVPVPNVTVTFTANVQTCPTPPNGCTAGASGFFASGATATAVTDASGVATAPTFVANTVAWMTSFSTQGGLYSVTASVNGLNANFLLTNDTVGANQVAVSGDAVGKDLEDLISITLPSACTQPTPPGCSLSITSSDSTKLALAGRSTDVGGGTLNLSVATGVASFAVYAQGKANSGAVTVTVSSSLFSPNATATILLAPSGFVLVGPNGTGVSSFSIGAGSTTPLTVSAAQLDPATNNFVQTQAVRAGVTAAVTVGSLPTSVGTITAGSLSFPAGTTSLGVTFNAISTGNAVVTASVPAGFTTPGQGANALSATVTTAVLSGPSLTIGRNLQTTMHIDFGGGAAQCGTNVTVTSADSTKVKFATGLGAAASGAIIITIPCGGGGGTASHTQDFYVQGLASSGSVHYTAHADNGFGDFTNGTITLAPSGFWIGNPSISGQDTTWQTSVSLGQKQLSIFPAVLDASGNVLDSSQLVIGDVNVGVGSSDSTVGTIDVNPALVSAGTNVGATLFTPVGAGTATVSLTAPFGYSTPAAIYNGFSVHVIAPSMQITSGTNGAPIGKYLQITGVVQLTAAAPSGGLQVTLSSLDPNLKIAATAAAAGSTSATITIPAGTSFGIYYLQALSDTGAGSYTAHAGGYTDSSGNVTYAPSGFLITQPGNAPGGAGNGCLNPSAFCTQLSGGLTALAVWTAQLNGDGTFANLQSLAGGQAPVTVNVTSSNTGIGTVGPTVTFTGGDGGEEPALFTPHAKSPPTTSVSLVGPVPAGFTQATGYQSVSVTVQ